MHVLMFFHFFHFDQTNNWIFYLCIQDLISMFTSNDNANVFKD